MTFLLKPSIKHCAVSITLIAVCLAMAYLQLWRAEKRGATFARQQSIAKAAPITLNATHRDAEALQWHPVLARGSWLTESTIFLDNKVHQQRVGYQVLTPLLLEGSSSVVLVNRGWVSAPRLRTNLPVVPTPSGSIEIAGIARRFEENVFEFGHPTPDGAVWQHVREGDYRQRSQLDALPVMVLQSDPVTPGAAVDGLIRDWSDITLPENPAWRHYGYAIMWVVFALMATGYGFMAGKRG